MTSDDQRAEAPAGPLCWCTGDEGDQVAGVTRSLVSQNRTEQPVRVEVYVADANAFAMSYGRDFRALHQLNRDHDCTSSCVKCVQKKFKEAAEEALRHGKVVACLCSSSTSCSLPAALYSLPSVLGRMPSSASAGKGRSLSKQRTSPAPMTATSSVRSFWCGTRLSDQRRRMLDKTGAAATSTCSSCLVPWIRTKSSLQRHPQINTSSSHRRIPNSLW